jgi:hypothetical protein
MWQTNEQAQVGLTMLREKRTREFERIAGQGGAAVNLCGMGTSILAQLDEDARQIGEQCERGIGAVDKQCSELLGVLERECIQQSGEVGIARERAYRALRALQEMVGVPAPGDVVTQRIELIEAVIEYEQIINAGTVSQIMARAAMVSLKATGQAAAIMWRRTENVPIEEKIRAIERNERMMERERQQQQAGTLAWADGQLGDMELGRLVDEVRRARTPGERDAIFRRIEGIRRKRERE